MKNLLLAGAALALVLSPSVFGQTARVRVVHASPDAPAVDVLVDGAKVLEALPFREYSEYLALPAGAHRFDVNVSGTTTTVLTASPTLAANTDYTVIAVGYAGGRTPALDVMLLTDDNSLPANNQVKLRVVHGAPGAPAVDVYATTPFESLDAKTATLSNVPFKAASGYLTVPVSTYQARVAVAGTKNIAIDSHRLVTWANMVRTIIAVDARGGGAPFDFIILPDRN